MGMGEPPRAATTDASGKYSITGVEPGRYRLLAERTGFVSQQYGARSGSPNQNGTILTLEKAQNVKDMHFRLIPQGVITGRVLDEDGEPVQNVMINCMRQAYVRGQKQWVPVNGQMTNDLGEYRLFNLAPGRYYVSATYRPGYGMQGGGGEDGYAPTYYPSGPSPDLASPVEVTAGTTLSSIDIQLRRAPSVLVRGRVVNAGGGNSARRTMVRLIPRNDSVLQMFQMRVGRVFDQAGSFAISGVAPGSYWLVAESAGEGGTRMFGRTAVDVGSGAVDDLAVTLSPAGELQGSVKIEGNTQTDTSSMRVQLEPRTRGGMMGGVPGAAVAEDGSFRVQNVTPQNYELRVTGVPETSYVKALRFGDADVTDAGLDLSNGVIPGELIVTVSPSAATIEGSVQDDKQQPVGSATVVLIPDGDRREHQRYYKMSNTDQNGQFSLKGLIPGEYRVYAFDELEAGAYMDPDFMRPFESRGERVSLKENGRENLQVKLISTSAAP
jgi:protocatechuate 3,4-dioxygenase beta subunit